ncbi:Putative zn(2)Cys(6) fungal-type DNA-binding domain-containing protein [Colletotrichum destructivum]|uniref:Zn(2)Cys(6) fungal-type DNA-binding domain-containing protein n=1 Tax=Colletotrichum destructivum TaxID=34406 RepID=A0AAX4INE6_9PEZI|nr:Putative zn(2)Cys(6) fungal-type DNA-binding domain-containing protein [Colletotrichum destructivum]
MDAEPSSVASSWAGSAAGNSANRKERGHIAQRACEVCRRRKQKCDEEKPTCGYCFKAQLECDYGSPKPTKKDKTLVELLDLVTNINQHTSHIPELYAQLLTLRDIIPASLPIDHSGGSSSSSDRASSTAILLPSRRLGPTSQHQAARRYASSVNKIMIWPAVRQTLENVRPKISGLQAIFQRPGLSSVLLEQRGDARRLPRGGVESMASQDRIALGIAPDDPIPVQMTTISPHVLEDHARIYFNTFNRIHPVLDRQYFMGVVFPRVLMNNFDEDASSTLLCLVLALAEVAMADVSGKGLLSFQDQPRKPDDTTEKIEYRPPGIEFFNEARRRLGFSMSDYSLENIQMYILTGLYYESCSQHTESWKMTISASLACHALIANNPAELDAAHDDQICRVFWYCSIAETSLQLELQLPLTGLDKLEPSIQLPQFPEYVTTTDQLLRAQMYNDRMSHYGEIFSYQISLRNLAIKVHDGLNRVVEGSASISNQSFSGSVDSLRTGIDELARQLEQWHSSLPSYLSWDRNLAPTVFPSHEIQHPGQSFYGQSMYAAGSMEGLQSAPITDFIASDIGNPHANTGYPNSDIVVLAVMRSRYYHLETLLYRPFIYKVLHENPDTLTEADVSGTTRFLHACVLWPIMVPPVSQHKRMIPCLYFWLQNILDVLVALHLSVINPILSNIRHGHCRQGYEQEAELTIEWGIAWIRDLKDADRAAQWCWTILKSLYRLD